MPTTLSANSNMTDDIELCILSSFLKIKNSGVTNIAIKNAHAAPLHSP